MRFIVQFCMFATKTSVLRSSLSLPPSHANVYCFFFSTDMFSVTVPVVVAAHWVAMDTILSGHLYSTSSIVDEFKCITNHADKLKHSSGQQPWKQKFTTFKLVLSLHISIHYVGATNN